jgi:type I restriction enzyme S subunit
MSETLPNGWVRTTVGVICVPKVEQRTPDVDFTYVDIGSVDNQKKVIASPNRVAAKSAPSRARQVLQADDVLVSLTRPNLNAVAIVPQSIAGAIGSTGFEVLRPVACEPRWLFAFVKHPAFVARMTGLVQGALYPAVRPSDVRETAIPLPPMNEQRRIVAKLEALQARSRRAREALDAVPPLLEKLRQSVLAAAFRGDLTKDWRAQNPNPEPASALLARIRTERRKKWEEAELAKLKAKGKAPTDDRWKAKYKEPEPVDTTGLPELPEGWCWASVEEIGLIESGQTTDGLSEHVSSEERHVPWFRVGDMNHQDNTDFMTTSAVWLSDADVLRFGLHVRPPRTIIFPKRGGAIATNKKRRLARPSTYDLNTMGVVPIDSLADYLWTWFQIVDLGRLNTGTSIPQINHGDIAPLPVPVPGPREAKRLAQVVEAGLARLRSIADARKSVAAELDDVERSLLAKAFRGELVPQDPNDEPADVMLARLQSSEPGQPKPSSRRRSKPKAAE